MFSPLHQGSAWERTGVWMMEMRGQDHQAKAESHIFLSLRLTCETVKPGRDSLTSIVQESNLSSFHT